MNRWTTKTEAWLRHAGWQPGRRDPTTYADAITAAGWTAHAAALEFLREFGGLRLQTPWSRWMGILGVLRLRWRHLLCVGEDWLLEDLEEGLLTNNVFPWIEQRLGPLCPIGNDGSAVASFYWMDADGRFFLFRVDDTPQTPIFVLGDAPEEAIESIRHGKCPCRR